MTTFRSEETLVGIIALAVVPWLVWRLRRGQREGRLPIGRAYVDRAERPGAYRTLFVFYVIAALMMAFIGLDLLFSLRSWAGFSFS
jgi:uncharacterized membrane protein